MIAASQLWRMKPEEAEEELAAWAALRAAEASLQRLLED